MELTISNHSNQINQYAEEKPWMGEEVHPFVGLVVLNQDNFGICIQWNQHVEEMDKNSILISLLSCWRGTSSSSTHCKSVEFEQINYEKYIVVRFISFSGTNLFGLFLNAHWKRKKKRLPVFSRSPAFTCPEVRDKMFCYTPLLY